MHDTYSWWVFRGAVGKAGILIVICDFNCCLLTVGSFNPWWHDRQYRRQVCRHVYQNKDSEAHQAHQGNLSPVDLFCKTLKTIISVNPNTCMLLPVLALQLLHKPSTCA